MAFQIVQKVPKIAQVASHKAQVACQIAQVASQIAHVTFQTVQVASQIAQVTSQIAQVASQNIASSLTNSQSSQLLDMGKQIVYQDSTQEFHCLPFEEPLGYLKNLKWHLVALFRHFGITLGIHVEKS